MSRYENRPVVRDAPQVEGGGSGYFELGEKETNKETHKLSRRIRELLKKLEALRTSSSRLETLSGTNYLTHHQRLFYLASHPLSPIQVPEFHRFDIPYWQVPYQSTGHRIITTQVTPHLEIWSGLLSSFDLGLRALVVDMAMQVYATDLLQTQQVAENIVEESGESSSSKHYAKHVAEAKAQLEAELLLAMAHSFRPEYVLAIAFATPEGPAGPKHLVGSIGAARGNTDQPLASTIGWDGSLRTSTQEKLLSSLPTNNALSYQLNEDGQELATVPENRIAEITRLNVAPRHTCEQLGITERGQLSRTLMFIIHHAIQHHLPEVEWELFNTQMALHRVIKQLGLPARVISQPETVQPTQLVSESVHGHYFRRTPPTPQATRVEEALAVTSSYFEFAQAAALLSTSSPL